MAAVTIIEEGEIDFADTSSGTHAFSSSFTTPPTVITSVKGDNAVNAIVTAVSVLSFTVVSSASFTGTIQFKAAGS